MKFVGPVLLTSALALSACGSHNHAPVVYGTDGAHTARIYNSPDEIYRKQQLERQRQAQRQRAAQRPKAQPAVARNIDQVELTPVSAVYLDDKARAQNAAPPAHLHRAKGYIEVQRGDTVYALARRFQVTPQSIIDVNKLRAPYELSVGQALKLPKGATVVAQDTPTRRVVARDRLYRVRKGDTLYSISRATKVQVGKIASANRLRAPYTLDIGQQLVIPQAPVANTQVPAAAPQRTVRKTQEPHNVGELARTVSYTQPDPSPRKSLFAWPVRGAVVSEYGAGDLGRRNDGVNIAAPAGTAVRAAADGEVVYRGSELDGFGNLLLIKHTDGFVTAYGHNEAMLVRKGQQVRQGQIIAKVGQTGAVTSPQLHFEIRQNLKSVDPVALLGPQ